MSDFNLAVGKTLWLEGNDTYVNDPDDPGGETIYGITRRDHPDLWVNGPPTREQAIERYKRDYWFSLYDNINDQEVASELMEFGVVAGPVTAVKKLQISLQRLGYPLAVDGIFGHGTLSAVNAADPVKLLREFRTEQVIRAVNLGEQRPALKKFMRQWIWRALASILSCIFLASTSPAQDVYGNGGFNLRWAQIGVVRCVDNIANRIRTGDSPRMKRSEAVDWCINDYIRQYKESVDTSEKLIEGMTRHTDPYMMYERRPNLSSEELRRILSVTER